STPIIRPRPRTSPLKPYFSSKRRSTSSISLPTRAEFSTSPTSRITSIDATPAAAASRSPPQPAELPPAAPDGGAEMRATDAATRKPAAHALPDRHDVGLETGVFGGPHGSRAAETGQDLVGDQ